MKNIIADALAKTREHLALFDKVLVAVYGDTLTDSMRGTARHDFVELLQRLDMMVKLAPPKLKCDTCGRALKPGEICEGLLREELNALR